jgi:NADP-dependent 3-hydroxy acid dehydrogenase YdfG
MVSLKEVRKSNVDLESLPPDLVAVFAGATAGIGLGTLRQFAKSTNAPRAYIIGRSRAKASHIIHELKIINPSGTFVFLEGQFSHIKDVDHMYEAIKKLETHVDILCMSTGAANFSGNKGEFSYQVLEMRQTV